MPAEPYDDPYRYGDNFGPVIANLDDLAFWTDPSSVFSILFGVGPYAATNCTVLWCNGKLVPQDIFTAALDTTGQIVNALIGLQHGSR